uniref:CSON001352 protein n=1 Tax=Culicoides sonorensis TaxID=179676 RepID=A0A336LLG3_CULSO
MTEYCDINQIEQVILKYNKGYKGANSVISSYFPKFVKQGVIREIDTDEEESKSNSETMSCNIPGCTEVFQTLRNYETHYNSVHRYSCNTCHKHLPNPHLLDLHIQETHDSFFAVASLKKPMFACYVEECNFMSTDVKMRHDHCIKDHKFPHDFRFDKITKVKNKKNQMEIDVETKEKVFEVPKGFHFGHKNIKGFVKEKKSKKSILESENMMDDLKNCLP